MCVKTSFWYIPETIARIFNQQGEGAGWGGWCQRFCYITERGDILLMLLFNRKDIKLSYKRMSSINGFIRKHNSKIMKHPVLSTIKTCNCWQKTNCPMDSSALFPKHLLTPLLKKLTMVLVKTFSKNITVRKNVLLEINLMKQTKDYWSIYGNWKRRIVEKC